jgi:alanine racemase
VTGINTSLYRKRTDVILNIDLGAIKKNWLHLKSMQNDSCDCGAVVKADAYGLGADTIAKSLLSAGCRTFYVAHLEEGIALRNVLGAGATIVVLHGIQVGLEADCYNYKLIPVINTLDQAKAWSEYSKNRDKPQKVILQTDTGMNRLGMEADDLITIINDNAYTLGLEPIALMSHLACASIENHPLNLDQLARFKIALSATITKFPQISATLSNSSGIFLGSEWHFNATRPGAALYGLNPQPHKVNPMRAVVTLKAKILQTRYIDTGDTVGYGATVKAEGRTRLATVSIGYADGFRRSLSNIDVGFIDGIPIKVAGLVSMDLLTFDVSSVPDSAVFPGQSIDILSKNYGPDELAKQCNTIGYEIISTLGSRFARSYTSDRDED